MNAPFLMSMTIPLKSNLIASLFKYFRLPCLCLAFIILISACLGSGNRLPPPFVLSPQEVTISIGENVILTPSYSTNIITDWVSENKNVATVVKGTVTGVGIGSTTIHAFIGNDISSPSTITVLGK